MHLRDLMPWHGTAAPASDTKAATEHPFVALQREMNRVFEDFWGRAGRPFEIVPEPRLDMHETDSALRLTIELPGMDAKDVEITCTDHLLTLRGEKRAEHETAEGAHHIVERRYGRFERSLPLPAGLDTARAEATFDKGVLSLTFPKTPEAKAATRRIEVKAA